MLQEASISPFCPKAAQGQAEVGPAAAAKHVHQPGLGPAKQCNRNEKLSLVAAITQPKHPHQRSQRICISQHAIEVFQLPWGLPARPLPSIVHSKHMSQMDSSPTLMGPPPPRPPPPTSISEIHFQASGSWLVLLSRYVLMDNGKSISEHPY